MDKHTTRSAVLVSAEALIRAPGDWIVLDATVRLPGQDFDPEALFLQERLPGARRLVLDDISDPDTDLPHMAPTPGRFARAIGRLGITADDQVLCTDRFGVVGACRAWWLFRLFGHDRVRVLDGGIPAFVRAGGIPETGVHRPAQDMATYRPRPTYARLAGATDVLNALGEETLVMDARAGGRFDGTTPEPRAGVRPGHMPHAVNLPYDRLLQDGAFVSNSVLVERLTQAGARPGRHTISTCGSGLTACVLTVGLMAAGFGEGAVYDGSWAEWGRDEELPAMTSTTGDRRQ